MESKFFSDELWKHIDAFATALTLALVTLDLLNRKQELDEINLYIKFEEKEKELIYPIKRKNFSRAELKGILRELHDGESNYSLAYMSEDDFLNNVFAVQDGDKDEFIMKIYKDDTFEYKRNNTHKANI
jgi:hypothetical protein